MKTGVSLQPTWNAFTTHFSSLLYTFIQILMKTDDFFYSYSLYGCNTGLKSDNKWHRICVLWRSTDGSLNVYADNKLSYSHLNAFQMYKAIKGGGQIYLGAVVGQHAYRTTAFQGSLNNVNIWSIPTNSSITFDGTSCETQKGGNFVSWKEFAEVYSSGIKFINSTACTV